ncbi:MAG TPA: FlgO family outer membrane protein [Thermoanaerobaculia bacterium]|nr:FlgO family outer membrane protein [Thermoanaerobaculia bacterium]
MATQIASSASKKKKQKIAILPFNDLDGKPSRLGSYISEELVTDLIRLGGFDIVERAMLDRLLGELKLEQSGLIDPATVKKVGKIAGVNAIVTGSITNLTSYVSLNCRLIDTQTGHIFAAAKTRIFKDADLKIMEGMSPPDGGRTSAPEPGSKQQAGNLIFMLKRCSRFGTSINCDFLIMSKAPDRSLLFTASASRMIDEGGHEYAASSVALGGRNGDQSASTTLTANVPVSARLTFEGISPESRRASLIELKEGVVGSWLFVPWKVLIAQKFREPLSIRFHNVPLVQP